MTFKCIDPEGKAVFGDSVVDDSMKSMCDAIGGTIVEDPIPEPEVEYAVVDDNIVSINDDGEVVEVVVELDMADIPPAEEIVVEDED